MKKYWEYFVYLIRHKWYVFRECRRYGITWLGLTHDLSKFLPREFFPYAKYYYGRELCPPVNDRYIDAWHNHQKTNKHHWHFWTMINGSEKDLGEYRDWETSGRSNKIIVRRMPDKYRKEMLCDWYGAHRAKSCCGGSAKYFYLKEAENMILHPETRDWIEKELGVADKNVKRLKIIRQPE